MVMVMVMVVVFAMKGCVLRNLVRGEKSLDTQDDNTSYTTESGGGGGVDGDSDSNGGGVCNEGMCS